jgi:hypothetical protein
LTSNVYGFNVYGMEIWKPVRGYEGLYEISNLARVRRVARGKLFTAAQVDEAKAMFQTGAALADVAAFLGTSITTAFNIKHGKTWAGDSGARAVKTHVARDHYVRFSPCKDGKYAKVAVHRAMWEAFNGPIPEGMEINHKNLDRADNRLDNFELLTHRENIKHAIDAYKAKGLLRAVKGTKGFIPGKHSKYDQ